jgi:8-oxo-dGTP pyrophosphatase MutT (NUDIX family)
MEAPRPAPGEDLNLGTPTVPRQAATVIVLRGGDERLEVLLVKRNPAARFMGGAWVFPGGAVQGGEGEGDAAHRAAAVRELAEEAGVVVDDAQQLVKFSRWITPELVKIRFDTHFFLAELPEGAEVAVDGGEVVDARWASPEQALELHRRGEILLVFPTIKHLEQLARFRSVDELLAHARGREVQPVEPRVIGGGEAARIVLPGEPGFEQGSAR